VQQFQIELNSSFRYYGDAMAQVWLITGSARGLGWADTYPINISCIIICFLLSLSTQALAQANSNFLTYTNTDLGFTMKYPSDWTVDDKNPTLGIKFKSDPCQFYYIAKHSQPSSSQRFCSGCIAIIL
jgi:hypothetical protein